MALNIKSNALYGFYFEYFIWNIGWTAIKPAVQMLLYNNALICLQPPPPSNFSHLIDEF